jgi:hypothetical protein
MGGRSLEVSCYAQRHRLARSYRKNEQAFVESFHRTLRKESLGWCKYDSVRGKNYSGKSKNT